MIRHPSINSMEDENDCSLKRATRSRASMLGISRYRSKSRSRRHLVDQRGIYPVGPPHRFPSQEGRQLYRQRKSRLEVSERFPWYSPMTDGLKKKRGWAAIGKPDVLPPALTRSTGKGSFHAAFSGWFKTALRNPNQISLRETLDMKSDAKSYMEEIVDPTIADFRDHPASRRHAFSGVCRNFPLHRLHSG